MKWIVRSSSRMLPIPVGILWIPHCLSKSVPAVVCLISSCHKYDGILWYLVCHEDHLHPPLEHFLSSNLVSCSPVHLQILLSWEHGHFDLQRWSLKDSKENFVVIKDLDSVLGTLTDGVRQHALVKAYGGRTFGTDNSK